MSSLSLKILETTPEIREKIGIAIKEKLIKFLNNAIKKSVLEIQKMISEEIQNSKTFLSLTGEDGVGILKGELGIDSGMVAKLKIHTDKLFSMNPAPATKLRNYSNNNFEIKTSKENGIEVRTQIDIIADADIDFFEYTSKNGELINWLDWLLYGGDRTPSFGENYKYYRKEGKGRSKLGIMIKSDGDQFEISSEFRGDSEENFLTKAIFGSQNLIKEIILRNVKASK